MLAPEENICDNQQSRAHTYTNMCAEINGTTTNNNIKNKANSNGNIVGGTNKAPASTRNIFTRTRTDDNYKNENENNNNNNTNTNGNNNLVNNTNNSCGVGVSTCVVAAPTSRRQVRLDAVGVGVGDGGGSLAVPTVVPTVGPLYVHVSPTAISHGGGGGKRGGVGAAGSVSAPLKPQNLVVGGGYGGGGDYVSANAKNYYYNGSGNGSGAATATTTTITSTTSSRRRVAVPSACATPAHTYTYMYTHTPSTRTNSSGAFFVGGDKYCATLPMCCCGNTSAPLSTSSPSPSPSPFSTFSVSPPPSPSPLSHHHKGRRTLGASSTAPTPTVTVTCMKDDKGKNRWGGGGAVGYTTKGGDGFHGGEKEEEERGGLQQQMQHQGKHRECHVTWRADDSTSSTCNNTIGNNNNNNKDFHCCDGSGQRAGTVNNSGSANSELDGGTDSAANFYISSHFKPTDVAKHTHTTSTYMYTSTNKYAANSGSAAMMNTSTISSASSFSAVNTSVLSHATTASTTNLSYCSSFGPPQTNHAALLQHASLPLPLSKLSKSTNESTASATATATATATPPIKIVMATTDTTEPQAERKNNLYYGDKDTTHAAITVVVADGSEDGENGTAHIRNTIYEREGGRKEGSCDSESLIVGEPISHPAVFSPASVATIKTAAAEAKTTTTKSSSISSSASSSASSSFSIVSPASNISSRSSSSKNNDDTNTCKENNNDNNNTNEDQRQNCGVGLSKRENEKGALFGILQNAKNNMEFLSKEKREVYSASPFIHSFDKSFAEPQRTEGKEKETDSKATRSCPNICADAPFCPHSSLPQQSLSSEPHHQHQSQSQPQQQQQCQSLLRAGSPLSILAAAGAITLILPTAPIPPPTAPISMVPSASSPSSSPFNTTPFSSSSSSSYMHTNKKKEISRSPTMIEKMTVPTSSTTPFSSATAATTTATAAVVESANSAMRTPTAGCCSRHTVPSAAVARERPLLLCSSESASISAHCFNTISDRADKNTNSNNGHNNYYNYTDSHHCYDCSNYYTSPTSRYDHQRCNNNNNSTSSIMNYAADSSCFPDINSNNDNGKGKTNQNSFNNSIINTTAINNDNNNNYNCYSPVAGKDNPLNQSLIDGELTPVACVGGVGVGIGIGIGCCNNGGSLALSDIRYVYNPYGNHTTCDNNHSPYRYTNEYVCTSLVASAAAAAAGAPTTTTTGTVSPIHVSPTFKNVSALCSAVSVIGSAEGSPSPSPIVAVAASASPSPLSVDDAFYAPPRNFLPPNNNNNNNATNDNGNNNNNKNNICRSFKGSYSQSVPFSPPPPPLSPLPFSTSPSSSLSVNQNAFVSREALEWCNKNTQYNSALVNRQIRRNSSNDRGNININNNRNYDGSFSSEGITNAYSVIADGGHERKRIFAPPPPLPPPLLTEKEKGQNKNKNDDNKGNGNKVEGRVTPSPLSASSPATNVVFTEPSLIMCARRQTPTPTQTPTLMTMSVVTSSLRAKSSSPLFVTCPPPPPPLFSVSSSSQPQPQNNGTANNTVTEATRTHNEGNKNIINTLSNKRDKDKEEKDEEKEEEEEEEGPERRSCAWRQEGGEGRGEGLAVLQLHQRPSRIVSVSSVTMTGAVMATAPAHHSELTVAHQKPEEKERNNRAVEEKNGDAEKRGVSVSHTSRRRVLVAAVNASHTATTL